MVYCPAEEAEGDGEEGAEDDAPVLVVEQVLLVLLVSPVGLACVVGLDNVLGLCSSQCILLASLAALSTRAGADISLSFIFLLLPKESSAEHALAVLVVSPEGADVGLVDVVYDDGGNGDDLCRASGQTAMRMRKSMEYSPTGPSSFWATRGAARPFMMSSSERRGAPCAEESPR